MFGRSGPGVPVECAPVSNHVNELPSSVDFATQSSASVEVAFLKLATDAYRFPAASTDG